jgi:hypothetical protein
MFHAQEKLIHHYRRAGSPSFNGFGDMGIW